MPPDYSGENLRGRSFKGQDLTGANFSQADIRGANFSKAILKGANFTGAKAGLQKRWTVGLLIASWLLSAVSGVFSIFLSLFVVLIFRPTSSEDLSHDQKIIFGIALLFVLLVFCIITLRKGLTAALGAFVVAFAVTSAVNFAGEGGVAAVFAVAGAGAVAVAGAGAVAGAVAVTFAGAGAVAAVFAVAGAGAGGVAGAGAGAGAGAFMLFSAYIGWRSLAGNEKDAWVRSFAITFAATGGTSFFGADLTDADFTGATLKNTDFRTANLTRTRFYEAKKLDLAKVDDSILAKRDILNLLVTLNGRNKSYIRANLKGANLIGADLKEANLKDTDISEATFAGACLEWANLTLSQAVGTDFTRAQMTGACVEAWNIESTTKLNDVDCRFIYLLENPHSGTDDRERRPSSGDFQPGEFTKLFEEVLNTVDLIFRNGIDWKAFVTSFKKVQAENEDTDLAIQSIANKGDGVVVVKVNVPDGTDKEKIHSDFMQNYQLALQAVEEKYKAQLQAAASGLALRDFRANLCPISPTTASNPPVCPLALA
ncbi:pentapeptide repeat-containing protein [Nostoc spongiaeforme FACHB-130]|uniref:Pentapeptide repeat-containing protein n=1 Tax=Nostoc spongiaeforme FACHB-130 TaxID=1357510 RepID=A0ABR8G158_9NOSO|nr:pentapeptide repeat-containing protein [Nostoc spongiaeforme FACHB-130]